MKKPGFGLECPASSMEKEGAGGMESPAETEETGLGVERVCSRVEQVGGAAEGRRSQSHRTMPPLKVSSREEERRVLVGKLENEEVERRN